MMTTSVGSLHAPPPHGPRAAIMHFLRSPVWMALLAACSVGGASGDRSQARSSDSTAAAPSRVTSTASPADPVTVNRPFTESVRAQREVMVSGPLVASRRATLRAELQGTVAALLVQVGQDVAAGTVLAELRVPGLEAQRASAVAQHAASTSALHVAERDLDRLRKLEAVGGASKSEIEDAEARLEAARASLAAAEALRAQADADIARTRIRASLGGTVAVRHVTEGSSVQPGQELLTLVDTRLLELQGSIPMQDVSAVHIGSEFDIQVPGRADTSAVTGRVIRIAPTVDSVTSQLPITVQIGNAKRRLPGGTWVDGRLRQSASGPARN